jgi:dihydroorotate dehydrogenase electron transfer subunit
VKAMRAAGFDEAQVSVLLTPPMPCGTGACQACAVQTRRGWKLACREGPLFPLAELSLTD